MIEAVNQKGDPNRTVFLSPTKDKLEAFLNFPTPSCRKDIQSIMGAAAQLKRWTPGLMLISPNLQKLTGANTPFHWNEGLQQELDEMKNALKEHVKLTPLDVTKDLLVWTDAAPSEGMAYILAQWKDPTDESKGVDIISCDSTTFKRGKRSLSPFEAEVFGVWWAVTKEHYYTRGAPKIVIMNDAKSMAGFIASDLEKVENTRAQAMLEELQPYNLEVKHVPGPRMEFLDHGSRNPISFGQHKVFDSEPGALGICVRSNRVMALDSVDVKDPKVETLAAIGAQDESYLRNVEHVENNSDPNTLEKSSELRQLRADWDRLSVVTLDRGKLIVRGDREILIPPKARKDLVEQLHLTHLSYQGMKSLASKKFFWPGMYASLEKKYVNCQQCRENAISVHDKPYQVIPEGLDMLAPGEQISVDFCIFNGKNILMIKDRVSGFIWGKVTKNQTSQEAFDAIMSWSHRMGIPHECRSDGGGSFRARFSQMLREVGVNHVHTSPYNSKSNGGVERSIRSIKDVLRKQEIKKVTQEKLDEITYLINQHPQKGEEGTPAERFFGRSPRSVLPNSLTRFVEHHQLIERRKARQVSLAMRKGRSAPNDFRVGDRVLIQDISTKKWNIPGSVTECRVSEDNSSRSFMIEKLDGSTIMRNAKFMKHEWRSPRRGDHVSFASTDEELSDDSAADSADQGPL